MKIELLISPESDLLTEIFREGNPGVGTVVENENFSLQYDGSVKEQGVLGQGYLEVLEMTVTFAGNIALGLFTNYLYDVIKQKGKKLWINGKETKIDKAEIEEAVKE